MFPNILSNNRQPLLFQLHISTYILCLFLYSKSPYANFAWGNFCRTKSVVWSRISIATKHMEYKMEYWIKNCVFKMTENKRFCSYELYWIASSVSPNYDVWFDQMITDRTNRHLTWHTVTNRLNMVQNDATNNNII